MKQQLLENWKSIASMLVLCSAFTVSAEDYERKFDVDPGGKLDLKTEAGSVKILTHDAASVLVMVEVNGKDADDFELSTELSGKTLEVVGEVEGRRWHRNLQVEFSVTVPEEFDIDIDTSGGSIRISDLTGDIDARTAGGSIRVGSIKGKVELNTSGGSIQTENIYGPLNAHTSGGSIRATFAQQLTEDATLDTSGGSITAYLVPDVKIDLDASTSGGRVKTDFNVNGRIKKQSIRGEINGGGPELQLRTSGGSVKVRSL